MATVKRPLVVDLTKRLPRVLKFRGLTYIKEKNTDKSNQGTWWQCAYVGCYVRIRTAELEGFRDTYVLNSWYGMHVHRPERNVDHSIIARIENESKRPRRITLFISLTDPNRELLKAGIMPNGEKARALLNECLKYQFDKNWHSLTSSMDKEFRNTLGLTLPTISAMEEDNTIRKVVPTTYQNIKQSCTSNDQQMMLNRLKNYTRPRAASFPQPQNIGTKNSVRFGISDLLKR